MKIKSIDDLTIGEYQRLIDLDYQDINNFEKDIKIISLFTNFDEKTLRDKWSKNSIDQLKLIVNDVINNDIEKNDLKPFKIKGVKYTFDKNLDKMSTGQFVDLMKFSENEKKIIENLHILTAILWRRKKGFSIESYNSETVMDRANLFKDNLKVSKAISTSIFFYTLSKNFSKIIVGSSTVMKKGTETTDHLKDHSMKNGDF
ncbi:MAG: hypothetical protein ACOCRX_07640 [Candidatus Woesearchaeota archaeon]